MLCAHLRPCVCGMQGDAEDLPFPTDSFDRYVSAGSIEYWWVGAAPGACKVMGACLGGLCLLGRMVGW